MSGPTIYAKLMEVANAQPERELYEFIEKRTAALTGDLASELAEQLRKAYQAGVVDGYQQGVVACENQSPGEDGPWFGPGPCPECGGNHTRYEGNPFGHSVACSRKPAPDTSPA